MYKIPKWPQSNFPFICNRDVEQTRGWCSKHALAGKLLPEAWKGETAAQVQFALRRPWYYNARRSRRARKLCGATARKSLVFFSDWKTLRVTYRSEETWGGFDSQTKTHSFILCATSELLWPSWERAVEQILMTSFGSLDDDVNWKQQWELFSCRHVIWFSWLCTGWTKCKI